MATLPGAEAFASAPWEVDPGNYRYDMTLYLDVSFAKTGQMDYSLYTVGAFVDDECRGIAEPMELPNDAGQVLYLRPEAILQRGRL